MKEVMRTAATQTPGGPELSSRGSVAIYTTQKLFFCIWEYLSPHWDSFSSSLRSLLSVSEIPPGLHFRLPSLICFSAVRFGCAAGVDQQSSAVRRIVPFVAAAPLALGK